MKKINVKKEQCIGCGACVAIDSLHFDFDDEGRSNVISNENLETANLTNAIESCPTSAIEIIESEENCDCETENCTCSIDNFENDCECSCCKDNCDCECDYEENCDCEEECDCGCCKCHEETEE